ncbi:hypothetical protein U9M48_000860 [Paspalum notatum var. saurae]|uniref:Uncharacterized protein n=1 Tax=Paspalum notatum var. saurae TaxID=547442 RepID=A0AAQ3PMF6_PASNO
MRRCAPGLRRVGEAMPASRRGRALELITGVKMPYPMVEGQLAFQSELSRNLVIGKLVSHVYCAGVVFNFVTCALVAAQSTMALVSTRQELQWHGLYKFTKVNVPKTEKTYCKNKECRKHTVQKVTRYKMVRPSLSSRRRFSYRNWHKFWDCAAAAAVATLPPGGCGRGSEVDVDGKLVQQPADVVRRLARQKDRKGDTPMHLTAHFNRVEILEVMLDFDQSLGYVTSEWNGNVPLLFSAASRGHVEFARALLKH